MKENKITVCVCDKETKTVVDQVDKDVPDIFNIFEVCDSCREQTKCTNCVVGMLQMDEYVV